LHTDCVTEKTTSESEGGAGWSDAVRAESGYGGELLNVEIVKSETDEEGMRRAVRR
jgi:hypothetical protein